MAKSKRTKTPVKPKAAKSAGLLFTIGYEQARPDAVLDELKRAKVNLLVDTRAIAASRRAGFSKNALAAALDEKDIAYIHLQKLGTPAAGRAIAKAGDFEGMLRMYDKYIKTPDAAAALDDLVGLVKSGKRVALLCYEREACECHRSHIAKLVKKRVRGIKVEDLVAPLF